MAEEVVLPMSMFMDLERSGPVPLYFQISQRIERAIQDGTLAPGSRLENEIAFGERLGLSRPTMRRAFQELVDKGLVVRRRGVGTQVVHGRVTRGIELTSLYDDLDRAGQHPETTVLRFEQVEAEQEVAEELGLKAGTAVLHVKRLRKTDHTAVAVMNNWLPPRFLDLERADLEEHGLYRLLRSRGATLKVAKQRIGARKANSEESELLDLERGAALLTMERTAFDSSGEAVEFGRHCYRPDLYSFSLTLVDK